MKSEGQVYFLWYFKISWGGLGIGYKLLWAGNHSAHFLWGAQDIIKLPYY